MKTQSDLETHIKYYVPKGWMGPIREFDFAPLISDEDFEIILSGELPDKREYQKWYIQAAIKDFLNNP